MNLLLPLLKIYTPAYVKKKALRDLLHFTAKAFGRQAPPLEGLSHEECLFQYAIFTRNHIEDCIRSAQSPEVLDLLQKRLYQSAHRLGQIYDRMLHPRTVEEVMALGRILYRILGIDFQGDAQGDVVIGRCYFSRFYSGQVCRIMSAMDCGLFAGLSGGGQLVFSSRISEGRSCCRARFSMRRVAG